MDQLTGADAQKKMLRQQQQAERQSKIETIQNDVGRQTNDLFRIFSRGLVFGRSGTRSSGQPPILGM